MDANFTNGTIDNNDFPWKTKLVINVYIVPVVVVLGIIGNVISIIVIGRDDLMQKTTRFLLQMLGVGDILYLISCLFFQTLYTAKSHPDTTTLPFKYHYNRVVDLWVWPVGAIFNTVAGYSVVIVAADRYLVVCHPYNNTKLRSTTTNARIAVGCVWLFAITFNLPRIFERTVVDCLTNGTELCNRPAHTEWGKDVNYNLAYTTISFFIFRLVIPLSLLTYFTIRLLAEIRSQYQSHAIPVSSGRSRHTTIALLSVVVVFIVCSIPDIVVRVMFAAGFRNRMTLAELDTYSNLFLTLNSAVNILLYTAHGPRFRRNLRQLCCGSWWTTMYQQRRRLSSRSFTMSLTHNTKI